ALEILGRDGSPTHPLARPDDVHTARGGRRHVAHACANFPGAEKHEPLDFRGIARSETEVRRRRDVLGYLWLRCSAFIVRHSLLPRLSVPMAHRAKLAAVAVLAARKPPLPRRENFVRAVLVPRHPPVGPGADSAHADTMDFRKF